MNKLYLIWSIEHNGWWRNNEQGYVQSKEKAGLYSFERAHEIVKKANEHCGDVPNEALVEYIK